MSGHRRRHNSAPAMLTPEGGPPAVGQAPIGNAAHAERVAKTQRPTHGETPHASALLDSPVQPLAGERAPLDPALAQETRAWMTDFHDLDPQDPAMRTELDRRGERGIQRAGMVDKVPTKREHTLHEPPIPQLGVHEDSAATFEGGIADNQFCGLVHIPSGEIHLAPLVPGAQGSTDYPLDHIERPRDIPIRHTGVGQRQPGDQPSHSVLADRDGLEQNDCAGFAVSKGTGGVGGFTWTSRSSNHRDMDDGTPKFRKRVPDGEPTSAQLAEAAAGLGIENLSPGELKARRGELMQYLAEQGTRPGQLTENWADAIADTMEGRFGVSDEREAGKRGEWPPPPPPGDAPPPPPPPPPPVAQ
jgi:hypothetical protein